MPDIIISYYSEGMLSKIYIVEVEKKKDTISYVIIKTLHNMFW